MDQLFKQSLTVVLLLDGILVQGKLFLTISLSFPENLFF